MYILFILVEDAWEEEKKWHKRDQFCAGDLGWRGGKEGPWGKRQQLCFLRSLSISRVSFPSAKFPIPENPSPACHAVLRPALHYVGSTWCHVTMSQKNAKPKTCPQSHSLTARFFWQILTLSNPLSKWHTEAEALLKPLYSFACCLDQYSRCLFTLLFQAPWRGTAAKLYLDTSSMGDQMHAGVVIYAKGKETPGHQVSIHKSTGSKELPSWAHCRLLQARTTGSNNNNQIKSVCHIMV